MGFPNSFIRSVLGRRNVGNNPLRRRRGIVPRSRIHISSFDEPISRRPRPRFNVLQCFIFNQHFLGHLFKL